MPLFRRRPLLRAAAVGGGAYMAGKHRAAAEAQEQAYQPAYPPPAPAPPPPAPPVQGAGSDDIARLQELGKLHEQGILTDEEFASQKAKILGTA
jgi:Short C-terminal domain